MKLPNTLTAKRRALGFASLLSVCLALIMTYPDAGLSAMFLLLVSARASRAWRSNAPVSSNEICIQHADPEQCLQVRP